MRKRLLSLVLAAVVTASTLLGVTIDPQAAEVIKDVDIPVVSNADEIDNADNLLSVSFGMFTVGDRTDTVKGKFTISEPSYVLLQTSAKDFDEDAWLCRSNISLTRNNGSVIASKKPRADASENSKERSVSALLNPGTYYCTLQVTAATSTFYKTQSGTATLQGIVIPIKKVITYASTIKNGKVAVKAKSNLGQFNQNMQYRNGKVSIDQVNNMNYWLGSYSDGSFNSPYGSEQKKAMPLTEEDGYYYANTSKNGSYTFRVLDKMGTAISSTTNVNAYPVDTKISSLKAKKKSAIVTWKKKSVTGYQVRYSSKSNMKSSKTVTIKKAKTTKYTLKKLKSNKKYYVQVRTYKTLNGKKLYSKWTKAKRVTVK